MTYTLTNCYQTISIINDYHNFVNFIIFLREPYDGWLSCTVLERRHLHAYSQMSFWAATVITNFFTAFPIVGDKIVTLLWGGFSVDNATLNRFFSLHYLLPFAITGIVIVHMAAVHQDGSNNPLGISSASDKISFFPYFFIKDTLGLIAGLIFFSYFVYFSPNTLGHSDNYIPGNPMVTPEHIVPEWYEWEVCGAFSSRYCV
jgi:quinol-cytochrome oxidoreductase complex cytochrome b subunit